MFIIAWIRSRLESLSQVKSYSNLERTPATDSSGTKPNNAVNLDSKFEEKGFDFNSVEGRNLEFIRNFTAIVAPDCN